MIGAWDEDEGGQAYIYFHGYPNARILSSLAESGTPICATASIVDGLVLALSAFSHSMNYRSAVLHGVILPFDHDAGYSDLNEEGKQNVKISAFERIVETAAPGRWENSRKPDESDLTRTGVIRMKVETASAKIRAGPPKDERKDIGDTGLVAKTWTGVVPLKITAGTPIPSPYCDPKLAQNTPEHVKELAKPSSHT